MKTIFMSLLFTFLLVVSSHAAVNQTESAEKTADIMKLLELFGQGQECDRFLDIFFADLSSTHPEIPLMELENIRRKFFDKTPYLAKGADIYSRHFTHNEIKEMVAFYSTPTGKKLTLTRAEMQAEIRSAFQELSEVL